MQKFVVLSCLLVGVVAAGPAAAAQCPGNPDALGTSRTLVVDPAEHSLLGGFQYRESLPLNDHEVVITFDDGPLPPYSTRILDILARECVKATYFMVGKMARAYPKVVRRTYEEGHTLANHSQSHPYFFHRASVEAAAKEINEGFKSIRAALGNPNGVAPFFRFPGLLRQDAVEDYLKSRKMMAWSVDFMADDWTRIGSKEIVRRALMRLEVNRKGILLLHDIQPATALGLPELLRELKVRGYRVVHVVPATPERPKTITTAAQWIVRNPPTHTNTQQAQGMWPRIGPVRLAGAAPTLPAPALTSFGAALGHDVIPLELVPAIDMLHGDGGVDMLRSDGREVALPIGTAWPSVEIAGLPDADLLPAPAADTFRYTSPPRARSTTRQVAGAKDGKKKQTAAKSKDAPSKSATAKSTESKASKEAKSKSTTFRPAKDAKAKDGKRAPRPPVGHQFQLPPSPPRPTANLTGTPQAR